MCLGKEVVIVSGHTPFPGLVLQGTALATYLQEI